MIVFKFIMALILTEAVTEVVVKSELFKPLRKLLFEKGNKFTKFLHDLLDCGYCTSVWVGCFMSLMLIDLPLIHWSIDWLLYGLAIHRVSNMLHFVIDKLGYIKE